MSSEAPTDDQVKHMVSRFLTWKLPANFRPDGGITFKPEFNEHTDRPMRHEPVGTNVFDYQQAEAMVRHMLEGLPPSGTAELEAENAALRQVISDTATHVGATVSPDCTVTFMQGLPHEAELAVHKMGADADRWRLKFRHSDDFLQEAYGILGELIAPITPSSSYRDDQVFTPHPKPLAGTLRRGARLRERILADRPAPRETGEELIVRVAVTHTGRDTGNIYVRSASNPGDEALPPMRIDPADIVRLPSELELARIVCDSVTNGNVQLEQAMPQHAVGYRDAAERIAARYGKAPVPEIDVTDRVHLAGYDVGSHELVNPDGVTVKFAKP